MLNKDVTWAMIVVEKRYYKMTSLDQWKWVRTSLNQSSYIIYSVTILDISFGVYC